MGMLWQKTENSEFNTPMLALQEKVAAGTATVAEFVDTLTAAKKLADAQSLKRTALQLALFLKNPPTSADLQDATKAAAITKNLERVVRNAQIRCVDLTGVKIKGTTLVYLSGFLTNNDRNDYVLGSIKRMEELFRDRPEVKTQPEVYAWSHTDLKNLFNLAVYNTFPNSRSSQAGYDLSAAVIMPLVADNFTRDAKGNVTGSPLPVAQARENLKNLTLVGYSAGSIVAQETFNASMKMMKKIGFAENVARDLMKDITLIAVGNVSRPSKEINRYTTITLVASNDLIMRAKNWVWGTLGTTLKRLKEYLLLRGWNKNKKELTIRPLSESSLFISASVRKSLYEWNYDKDGARLNKRPFDPLLPEWTLIRSYHEIPHYTTMDKNNNGFACIAHHALVNAFNRTRRLTPQELIMPTEGHTHTPEQLAEYVGRVRNATREMLRR